LEADRENGWATVALDCLNIGLDADDHEHNSVLF